MKSLFRKKELKAEDSRLTEEAATDAAYAMEKLYKKKGNRYYDCVYEATENMELGITKQEAELMWRAIDAYADLNSD